MQINNSVIQLAKERALFGHSALMQRVIKAADDQLVEWTTESPLGIDQYTVGQCRQFIKVQGQRYHSSVVSHFKQALDRAMETMYSNVRVALANISADNLTLVDDATVTRQIEIDKLVSRLRDADNEHLKRLNLVIAQMHGDDDIKERENPFRPYLIVHSMHEVLHDMIPDPEGVKMLYGCMSAALQRLISEYYESVYDVFASNGVHANLIAKRTQHHRAQRYKGGELVGEEPTLNDFNQRILPNLQRMLGMMERMPATGTGAAPVGMMPGAMQGGYPTAGYPGAMAGGMAGGMMGGMPGGGQGVGPAMGAGGMPDASGGAFPSLNIPDIPGGAGGVPVAGQAAQAHGQSGVQRAGLSAEQFHQFIQSLFRSPMGGAGGSGVGSPTGAASGSAGPGQVAVSGEAGIAAGNMGSASAGSGAFAAPDPAFASFFPDSAAQAISAALVARLNEFQQQAALGKSIDEAIALEKNQLFAVNEKIAENEATKFERVSIDVVAMLFEFILEDDQIPAVLRSQISRLQIPFLKAAMLQPQLLKDADHPARRLLNRMGSAALGLDIDSEVGKSIEAEVTRIVRRLLHEFTDDCALFATCLEELEQFLAAQFLQAGPEAQASAEAIEEFETKAINESTPIELERLLAPLNVDARAVEFICSRWARVLSHEMTGASHDPDTTPGIGAGRILSELVWSVLEKHTPQERAELVKLLPKLVTRVRKGLMMAGFAPPEVKQSMDLLVALHTQALRLVPSASGTPAMTLAQVRQHFSRFDTAADEVVPVVTAVAEQPREALSLAVEPTLEAEAVESALAEKGVSVKLDLQREPTMSFESDADWLTRLQIGTCIERWSDTGYVQGRLTWISKRKTLYMFHLEGLVQPVVYSKVSLIRSLREGSVRLVEYAPVFDRAVEALLDNARAINTPAEPTLH